MLAIKNIRVLVCAALLAATLALSACAVPSAADHYAPYKSDMANSYMLQPGDLVRISVYGEETMSGQYVVDPQGDIVLPMLGNVAAAGTSKNQLQQAISGSLRKRGYYSKPLVTVEIQTMRPFYILGEVKAPGSYAYSPSLDVFKAIALAGGYTPRAAKNKVLIDRGSSPTMQRFNATEATPILPGDSIIVRERLF